MEENCTVNTNQNPEVSSRIERNSVINFSPEEVLPTVQNNNGPENQTETPTNVGWRHFTLHQYAIIITFSLGNLACGACYSVIAPFFPQEADKKGLTESEYGIIFGVYYLFVAFASPVWGKLIPIVSPKFCLLTGLFWTGACSVLFGFLNESPPGATFFGLALAIRSVEAFGIASYWTSSVTFLAMEFTNTMASVMTFVESFFGLGMIIGPVFGGFLFEMGGYPLPFHVLGAVLLVIALLGFFLVKGEESRQSEQSESLLKLVLHPGFIVRVFALMSLFLSLGFNEATLATHLDQFHMSPATVGAVFMACGGIYTFSSPVYGVITDRIQNPTYLCITGCAITSLGLLIIGPVPFIPIKLSLWMVIVAQLLLGIGVGTNVIFMIDLFKHALGRGFPDSTGTYSLVTGTIASVSGGGGFLGPSMGGFLVQHTGYNNASMIMFFLVATTTAVLALYTLWEWRQSSKPTAVYDETTRLIKDT